MFLSIEGRLSFGPKFGHFSDQREETFYIGFRLTT
jgi:hypothetical protein